MAVTGVLKYYLDAKIDRIQQHLMQLVDYMVNHEGKIARLEKRTQHL